MCWGPGVSATLAARLTGDVNEVPAVWCLFSLGLVLMALNPVFRQNFEWRRAGASSTAF